MNVSHFHDVGLLDLFKKNIYHVIINSCLAINCKYNNGYKGTYLF